MEIAKSKYNQMEKMLVSLEQAIQKYKHSDKFISIDPDIIETLQDSMIKRFEYTVDHVWKYIKIYLEEVKGVPVEVNTPKDIYREAFQAGIISEKETSDLIEMIKLRNQTSHIYKQELADAIARDIPRYYELMRTVMYNIKP